MINNVKLNEIGQLIENIDIYNEINNLRKVYLHYLSLKEIAAANGKGNENEDNNNEMMDNYDGDDDFDYRYKTSFIEKYVGLPKNSSADLLQNYRIG